MLWVSDPPIPVIVTGYVPYLMPFETIVSMSTPLKLKILLTSRSCDVVSYHVGSVGFERLAVAGEHDLEI